MQSVAEFFINLFMSSTRNTIIATAIPDAARAREMRDGLARYGFNLLPVGNRSALEGVLKGSERVELALIDLDFPEPSEGAAIAKRVHRDLGIPVVLLSGRVEREELEYTDEEYCYGFERRSADPPALAATLKIALRLSKSLKREEAHKRDLEESRAICRSLIDHFPNGMITYYNHDLVYVAAGGEGLKATGLKSSDFEGKRLRDMFPPEVYERDEPRLNAALEGRTVDVLVPYQGRHYRVITAPVHNRNGRISGGVVMTQDLSELVSTKEELELLLRETSHRIKNNLITVEALLKMYGEEHQIDLSALERQLVAIRTVHEELHTGAEGRTIEAAEFLRKIVASYLEGYPRLTVDQVCSMVPCSLHAEQAVPLGLIVNELCANAFKHGNSQSKSFLFRADLTRPNAGELEATVENSIDGAAEIDLETPKSGGFVLLKALARQLDTELVSSVGETVRMSLRFRSAAENM